MGNSCSACFGRKVHGEDEHSEHRRRKNLNQQETPEEREQRQKAIDQRLEQVRTFPLDYISCWQIDRRGLKSDEAVEKLKQFRSQCSQEPVSNPQDQPLHVPMIIKPILNLVIVDS